MGTHILSLFPLYFLRKLAQSRGRKWERLVSRVSKLPETDPQHMAYTLTIRRVATQNGAHGSAVQLEPTCAICAVEVIDRYEVNERELMATYHESLAEVEEFLAASRQLDKAA